MSDYKFLYAKGCIVDMGDVYQMVIEECPYCHGRHCHGAGDKSITEKEMKQAEGHRAAHCGIPFASKTDGYYIIWDGTVKKYNQLKKVDKMFMRKVAKLETEFQKKFDNKRSI